MKDFVAQDLFEDCTRVGIVLDEFSVHGETAGSRFFRDVQERE